MTGFILGAGLGTRLRPLTDHLPKPLVPVGNRPLIEWTMDRMLTAGVDRFVVNTHHLPGAYADAFPGAVYRGCPVHFRHEPVLLDTAGGIRNSAHLLTAPFLVANGDILSDVDFTALVAAHRGSGNVATLALRSRGPVCNVAIEPGPDRDRVRVVDLRSLLQPERPGTHQYTGMALLEPALLDRIPPDRIVSLVPVLVEAIRAGLGVGGVVLDGGEWRDLGTPREYLAVHRELARGRPLIDPQTQVEPGAVLEGSVVLGAGSVVESDVVLRDVVVWGGIRIRSGSRLEECIACGAGEVPATTRNGGVVEAR